MASDIMTQKIPNLLSIFLIAGFVVSVLVVGMSWQEIGITVGIAALFFAMGYVMFLAGGMGAGDVKLMFSTVLWIGSAAMVPYLMALAVSSICLITLALMARHYTPSSLSERVPFLHAWIVNPSGGVPYGLPLGIAGLYAIVSTPLFSALI